MEKKIAVILGDGIGPEVTKQSIRVLDTIAEQFGHKFEYRYGLMGADAIDKTGNPLPDRFMSIRSSTSTSTSTTIGITIIGVAVPTSLIVELDAEHVLAIDPHAFATEEPALAFELDDAVAHADEHSLHAASVAKHEGIRAHHDGREHDPHGAQRRPLRSHMSLP